MLREVAPAHFRRADRGSMMISVNGNDCEDRNQSGAETNLRMPPILPLGDNDRDGLASIGCWWFRLDCILELKVLDAGLRRGY